MKNTSSMRVFRLLLALVLCVSLVAGISVMAADNGGSMTADTKAMTVNNAFETSEMLAMLNSQTLHPQSTGYAYLDQWIDSLLAGSTDQTPGGKFLYAYQWVQYGAIFDQSSNYDYGNQKYVNPVNMHPYDMLKDFIGTSGLTRIPGTAITMPDSVLNHFYYIIRDGNNDGKSDRRGACFDFNTFTTVVARYIGFEAVIHAGEYQMESWSGSYGATVGHGFCIMTFDDAGRYIFDAQRDFRYAEAVGKGYTSTFFGIPRDGYYDRAYNDNSTANNHYAQTIYPFNEKACNVERDSRWTPTTAGVDVDIYIDGQGTGSGQGFYLINRAVTLTATPTGCSTFEGWYTVDGAKVSSDTTLTFWATKDIVYTAKFVGQHSYVNTVVKPTCTTQGYTEHKCSKCGTSYKDAYTAATGHKLTTVTTATCTEAGTTTVTCANCDYTKSAEAAALGHNYEVTASTATCTEGGQVTYTCSRCHDSKSETVECLGHNWKAWTVATASTATEAGTMTRSCTRCTEVETSALPAANPFTDVESARFYYIPTLWAVNEGITTGMSETEFVPNAFCTRGQVVTFLWRAAGKPEPAGTSCPFTDVVSTAYYYKAMLWAVENGITTGMSETEFAPNSPCTRGQIVTFLWRAAGKPAPTVSASPFTDVVPTAFYYQPMLWAVENGITTGMSETEFAPTVNCTRGQVVTFLFRWKAPF